MAPGRPRPRLSLVLFDCDGTLFASRDGLAEWAMHEALRRATGASIPNDAIGALDHEAQPARWLAREVVRRYDLPPIDLAAWARLVEEVYFDAFEPSDARGWETPPWAAEAIGDLIGYGFRVALMTGVPEQIARHRMGVVGLAHFFPAGEGAFGSEVDDRDALIGLALGRADVSPAEAVHVGDTARDVESARTLGLRTCLVEFGGGALTEEAHPDAVVRSMPELVDRILVLRDTPRLRVVGVQTDALGRSEGN